MKTAFGAITLCLTLSFSAGADTIVFNGVPTGVNDGQYYVMPYEVAIDGVAQLVACYDIYDEVNFGDVWQANILTLGQVAASGFFSDQPNAYDRYARIGWLESQTYSNNSQQIGLQYAIWSVFGTAPATADALAYEAAADRAAASDYAGFDLNQIRFIEQMGGVPGQNGTKQAFVFDLPDDIATVSPVLEPASAALGGVGLLLLACRKRWPD